MEIGSVFRRILLKKLDPIPPDLPIPSHLLVGGMGFMWLVFLMVSHIHLSCYNMLYEISCYILFFNML